MRLRPSYCTLNKRPSGISSKLFNLRDAERQQEHCRLENNVMLIDDLNGRLTSLGS